MVVTQEEDVPQPTESEIRREWAEAELRLAIAGHPDGAVRRIILYCVLVIGMTLTAVFGTVGLIVALPTFLLLALTDDLT